MPNDDGNPVDDVWFPFRYFLGNWIGTATGEAGEGSTERSYSLTLDDQFIKIKNRSVYPPQERNPTGEVHEELGMISFDRLRSRYVLREFHVEGYVNQYILESDVQHETTFVFGTEAIENLPEGWRARTTLEILSEDSFRETFYLAGPGEAWACFIISELTRSRP